MSVTDNNPIDLLVNGKKTEALYIASKQLAVMPSDPFKHLTVLQCLSDVAPESLPEGYSEHLSGYFVNTSNFSSALAVLVYSYNTSSAPSENVLKSFLEAFGGDSSSGFSPPPVKKSDESQPIEIPDSLIKEDAVDIALEAISGFSDRIFLPPPMPPRKVPLFHRMGLNSLKQLLGQGQKTYYKDGEIVIKQGEKDDFFYILISGTLKVFRKDNSITTRLGFLRSGSFFGEMALVTNSERSASVVSSGSSVVLKISWELLNNLLENDPDLAKELAAYTRHRLLRNLMSTSPMFKLLSPESKQEIMASFSPYIASPGEFIVKEGKPSKGLFMVASGEVSVFTGQGANKTLLSTLIPGDVFGEISLIRESAATASVRTDEGAVLMLLSRETFQKLAIKHPEFLSHVYQVALSRTEMNKEVESKDVVSAEDLIL